MVKKFGRLVSKVVLAEKTLVNLFILEVYLYGFLLITDIILMLELINTTDLI